MRKLIKYFVKIQVIHYINRDFTHQVIETRETLWGFVLKRELRTELM